MRVVLTALVGVSVVLVAGCADPTPTTAEHQVGRVAIPVAPPVQHATERVAAPAVWLVRAR
ncbi:hypothetical protein [Actinokineospora inagensis]|uniref:hypothetical protein n=1 Tax=Actinokineospora inagensis TaxID=103730 RepID=UPI000415F499|nr:hypothetical protein [Actinokineospora inagensis]